MKRSNVRMEIKTLKVRHEGLLTTDHRLKHIFRTSSHFFRVFDFVCHVCCVFCMKIGHLVKKVKVKIYVCVRYNRNSAYCVPTVCVLRTVLIPPEYCVLKGGCHPQIYSIKI